MKKMKWIALVALTLAAVMALSSCALFGGKGTDIVDLLDTEKAYVDDTVTYANAAKVDALTEKSRDYDIGYGENLVCFTEQVEKNGKTYTSYTVYNLEANSVVYTVDNTATSRVKISIDYHCVDGECYDYFLVTTVSWAEDENGNMKGRYTVRTELYDGTGTRIDGVAEKADTFVSGYFDEITTPDTVADLLYFNGKCYRFGEDGKLNKAFEYSALADLPNVYDRNDEYYLAYEGYENRIVIYNLKLEEVSAYRLPDYEVEVTTLSLVKEGKIVLQYCYELAADAKKYDFVSERTFENGYREIRKYDLVTLLVDAEKGKAKEIDCEYLIKAVYDNDDDENSALSMDGYVAFADVQKIENERISEREVMAGVTKKGKIEEITFNGETVWEAWLVADNRVLIETEMHYYLTDREGNVIGKIDNVDEWFGNYLLCGNKVYDLDLNVKLDLGEKNLVVYDTNYNYLLLQNADGDILLYTGDKDPYVIAEDDGDYYLYNTQNDYYVIVEENDEGNDAYEIYNAKGEKIVTLSANVHTVASTEEVILLQTLEKIDGVWENVYYRLTK